MFRSNLKYLLILSLGLMMLCSFPLSSQSQRVKERVKIIKNMKLLDALELDEATEEKVIESYNNWEKKIEKHQEMLTETAKELNSAITKSVSDKVINKLVDDYVRIQQQLQNMVIDKNKEMKRLLGTRNYAKFVVFEHFFNTELRKIIFKSMKNKEKKKK